MRVRDWQEILSQVVSSDGAADEWRAVAGRRRGGIGEDMFLSHPSVGVYQLKTFAKNPFEVRGVGSRVARRIDDELEPLFPEGHGRFGINSAATDESEAERRARRLQTVVQTHAEAPTSPDALFEDVMDAIESPAFGPIEYDATERSESLDELSNTFDEAEDLLTKELDELIDASDVDRGFH